MQVLQSHNQYTESVKISPAGSGRSADVLLVTTDKNTRGGALQQVHSFATIQTGMGLAVWEHDGRWLGTWGLLGLVAELCLLCWVLASTQLPCMLAWVAHRCRLLPLWVSGGGGLLWFAGFGVSWAPACWWVGPGSLGT